MSIIVLRENCQMHGLNHTRKTSPSENNCLKQQIDASLKKGFIAINSMRL